MNKFIFKIIIFVIPVLGLYVVEGFLPSFTFTYRPWEALDFQTKFDFERTFYPNKKVQMEAVGQLCHHTPHAIVKEETWKTDKLGNRNDTFIQNPDVLIIGDSFMAGCCVTQDSTITNLLKSELGDETKIYNIAPGEFSRADYYLSSGIIEKPDLIVYSKSERYVPKSLEEYKDSRSLKTDLKKLFENNSTFSGISVFLDKALRHYSKNWLQARLTNQNGDGVPGVEGSGMFFFNTAAQEDDPNLVRNTDTDLERTKNNIVSYKEYCDANGIDFLFLPMPNKATVYYEYVPFKEQPDYLFKLDSMLRAEGITTVNTLKLYNDYRESNDKLLYHLDDTHWNSTGVYLVSKELAGTIENSRLLARE
ncbi:hypothetical protein D1164_08565 [Mariniphaga sediminis]|jgi:hypothetical protein|uniref:AlgX/AlgJ SGNH hydrolase-like domain-containing protein n=2 Tax=Mariniphaga sediminis TaxID=1628158 RepID=A0A399D4N3_9BACT|nr:hypothetical protein [Mariniphaga sediminis]RIH65701.1 hypothetical protein D1164_08565 [Mariniphaga sediminis]